MDSQTNTFSGGLNKDVDVSIMPNDTLRDALNIRIVNFDGSSFVLSNIEGTRKQSALSEGFIPMGWKVYDEIAYIFSYDAITGEGEVGTFPSPDYNSTNKEKDLVYEYKALQNFRISSLSPLIDFRTSLFNFNEKFPLSVELRIDFDNSINIYFTDNKNPIRVINAGFYKDEITKKYIINGREYNNDDFSTTITLIPSSSQIANFEFIEQLQLGQLSSGGYIYHLQYSNDKINLTDIVASSFVVQVYERRDGNMQIGSENPKFGNSVFANETTLSDDVNTDIANVFDIEGLDLSYRYIHITVEYISGENQANRIVYRLQNPYEFSLSTFRFIHSGRELRLNIGESELNQIFASFTIAKDITQADSRLLAANIKAREGNQELRLLKNFAQRISVSHIKKNLGRIVDFNTAEAEIAGDDIALWDRNTFIGNSINDYRNTKVLYDSLGYWYGEMYLFAVQFIYKDNALSPCFLIQGRNEDITPIINNDKGVYRFPDRSKTSKQQSGSSIINTANHHSENLVAIFPEFTIPNLDAVVIGEDLEANNWIKENTIGIKFLRQERRKDALFQGLMMPTYSFPTLDWAAQTRTIVIPFRNAYQEDGFTYDPSTYWINDPASSYVDAKRKYIADTVNRRKVAPLPFGFIEGDTNNNPSLNEMIGCILAPAYADPSRYAIYSLDQVLDPSIRNIVNNNRSSLYIVSIARAGLSNFTGGGEVDLSAALSPMLANIRFDSQCITDYQSIEVNSANRQFRINSFYVEYDLEVDNNKFTSAIKAPTVDTIEVFQDTYIEIQNISWNGYIGITLGESLNGSIAENFSVQLGQDFDLALQTIALGIFNISSALRSMVPYYYRPSNRLPTDNALYDASGSVLYAGNYYDCFIIARAGSETSINSMRVVSGTYAKVGQPVFGIADATFPSILTNRRVLAEELTSESQVVDKTPGKERIGGSIGNKDFFNNIYNLIVNYYVSSEGRYTGDISTWYDETLLNFFFPISKNIPISAYTGQEAKVIGTNGDNYLGLHYQQVWQSKWKGSDVLPNGNDNYANGGIVQQIITDNNYNPYSRTRELRVIGENSLMSNSSLGNRRTFFPLTKGFTNTDVINNVNGIERNYQVLLSLFTAAKQIHNQQSQEDNRGGSIQNTAYVINNIAVPDLIFVQDNFPTRVWYSEKHITNSFVDGYRAFRPLSFQDFDIKYGSITAIRTLGNQVYIIQERAVSLLAYNERTAINENGNVFIDNTTILSPYQQPVSQEYGSQHKLSVLSTDNTIYGVDVANLVLWRINGGALELLSENVVKSFLLPILSLWKTEEMSKVTVQTFYDRRYREILFSFFLKGESGIDERSFTLCYSEKFNKFSSFYSFIPTAAFSIYEQFYSIAEVDGENEIFSHDNTTERTQIYGNVDGCYIKFICNKGYEIQKIFDNIVMVSNHILPIKLTYKIEDESGNTIEDEIEYAAGIPTNVINNFVGRMKHKEGTTRVAITSTNKEGSQLPLRRNRGKHIEIGVYYDSENKIALNAITVLYRYSKI